MTVEQQKYCRKCDTTKPLSEFYKGPTKLGVMSPCKQCKRELCHRNYVNKREAKVEAKRAAYNGMRSHFNRTPDFTISSDDMPSVQIAQVLEYIDTRLKCLDDKA